MTDSLSSILPSAIANSEPLAPWRSPLSRALHRNRSQPFARFFQLATVRANNTPANRTVVFRGFLLETNRSDDDQRSARAAKRQIRFRKTPTPKPAGYFTKTREQFRLSGSLTLVTADTPNAELNRARQQLWQNISDSARLQFAWPQPKHPRDPNADSDAFNPPAPDEQTPLDTFSLLILTPRSVDYLSLRGEPQTRKVYSKISSHSEQTKQSDPTESAEPPSEWSITTVNP